MTTRLDRANAIRALSMDAVQKANSGHPGAPMGMADMAEVLWHDFLKHNPENPDWADRDRFVLSNGHGSMLLYSLLHLTGYDLSIDDLKNFRQLHSKTPGHPELGYAPGIETTTGPLGQGLANGVGMAIAEKTMAAQFNREDHTIVDHNTYVFLGDGCLMEGISHEVASLAGTLGLGKLVVLYDDNGISIDGEVEGWFTDDTRKRFESYGWQVIPNIDGHDADEITTALNTARDEPSRPSLLICRTLIGKGSPNKEGTESCHGAPLGADEIELTRKALGWEHAPFEVPADIQESWNASENGAKSEADWTGRFEAYKAEFPSLAEEFERRMKGDLPVNFAEDSWEWVKSVDEAGAKIATRKASQNAIEAFGPMLPELMGGSADLAPSNLTTWSGSRGIQDDTDGNYIHYGVREFGMTAIMNGLSLHGGFRPYGATFLVFMEYARNAVRMSAIMKQPAIHVYTHDSIGLGEDGPTHQPIEQVANLRSTPGLTTWRPCDAVESAVAWRESVLQTDAPSALIFSRQGLPHVTRTINQIEQIALGGYVVSDDSKTPELILIATGSEVELAMTAAETLREKGKSVRVVSMPSLERFLAQPSDYRDSVLPPTVRARLAIEAGIGTDWYQVVGLDGDVVCMTTFGESAPAGELFKLFGFTTENVVEKATALL